MRRILRIITTQSAEDMRNKVEFISAWGKQWCARSAIAAFVAYVNQVQRTLICQFPTIMT